MAVDPFWVRYPIPVPDGGTSTLNRLLTLSYGTAGSAADALSQVTAVTDSDLGLLASFQYTGTGRRVAFNRGGTALSPVVRSSIFANPIADWDQSGGPDLDAYFGLNHFGQTRALAYWRGTGTSTEVLAAHRYAHDAAGRRTAIWNQQIDVAPPTGPPVGTNERSQHFAYDALGRLIEADMGKLEGPLNDPVETTTLIDNSSLLPIKREATWTLDSRDVWVSRILSHNADDDSTPDVETTAHFVGNRNELLGYDDPAAHSNPLPALSDRYHNDASGNLILDDDRFYEYDAWGRLVQVSLRGTLTLDSVPVGEDPLTGAAGDWLVHYTYDALGRLIRKQTPIRDGSTNEQLAVRTERYFYDGARRIQEVVTDPIVIGDPGDPGGGEIPIEEEMLEPGSGGTGGGGSGGGGGVLTNGPYVDREYVYVPSGASGYVDEFICQVDRYQDLWYILQDVNYNVIALTDSGGEVVRQHTFDPYGEILTAEDFDTHPGIKVGHQGLFFDRLEPSAPAGGLISMSAAVQLQPGIFGLYQARNRVLLPRYGRWAQKDPNASGMLHASLWHDGESPIPELAAGSLQGVTTDGSNLFAFVGNSPYNATDPTGLFYNPFSPLSTVSAGVTVGSFAVDLVSQYNQNLEFAIEWALDPTMDPDWLETTVKPDWSVFDPTVLFKDIGQSVTDHLVGGAASTTLKALKIGGKIARRGHWHHIIPRYLAKFTRGSEVLVRLPKKLHAAYHKQLDYALRAKGAPHMRASKKEWTKWVNGRLGGDTELAKKIVRETLERETKKFGKKHDIPDLYKILKQELDLIE